MPIYKNKKILNFCKNNNRIDNLIEGGRRNGYNGNNANAN